jgi:hypothetical protein
VVGLSADGTQTLFDQLCTTPISAPDTDVDGLTPEEAFKKKVREAILAIPSPEEPVQRYGVDDRRLPADRLRQPRSAAAEERAWRQRGSRETPLGRAVSVPRADEHSPTREVCATIGTREERCAD